MISRQFKKSIVKRLKDDYNVVCHSIHMDIKQHNRYHEYTLSCSVQQQLFTLSLILNICPVDSPSELYSFYVFAKPDCIPDLMEKISYPNVVATVKEVEEIFRYLHPSNELIFKHSKITIISGTYFVGSSCFEIKSIKTIMATMNVGIISDFINNERTCTDININDGNIFASSSIYYAVNHTFKEADSVLSGDLEIFKANFAKSVVFYLNKNCGIAGEANDQESDYMSLNYEDLKRYLLVKKMIIH